MERYVTANDFIKAVKRHTKLVVTDNTQNFDYNFVTGVILRRFRADPRVKIIKVDNVPHLYEVTWKG